MFGVRISKYTLGLGVQVLGDGGGAPWSLSVKKPPPPKKKKKRKEREICKKGDLEIRSP